MPSEQLKQWFLKRKRVFPWRETPTPYAVWVSEVMLQQTRASVVVPYFLRWMERFPDLVSLARASVEEVVKMWEGLGYYRRARNLRLGAIWLVEQGKEIPGVFEELLQIQGIGRYTAGAILSFAFHQKAAAVDGNVARVMSRYQAMEEDLSKVRGQRRLEQETLSFLPQEKPWVVMEALIELGATVCTSTKPQCLHCPLRDSCKAYEWQIVDRIPLKTAKTKETVNLQKQVVILFWEGEVLLQVHKEHQLLGGLAEFPSFPLEEDLEESLTKFHLQPVEKEALPMESQSFTIYQVELFPMVFEVLEKKEIEGFTWYPLQTAKQTLTFSSGHKRILDRFYKMRKTDTVVSFRRAL